MNNTNEELLVLGSPLAIASSISIFIGAVFTFLCILKVLRQPNVCTHYTYIVRNKDMRINNKK